MSVRSPAAVAVALALAAGAVPVRSALAQAWSTMRVPTPFVEDGEPLAMTIVIAKPARGGPFPLLLFNHGSTGLGNDPSIFPRVWASPSIARFFTDRGWLVAYPQRRGRGGSDGRYDEGFTADRSRYSCVPAESLAGLERALEDIDVALEHLRHRPDVDPARMLIGGQSRGGILAIAHAGTRPGRFVGAVNFVGGWMSDRCPRVAEINTATFRRAAAHPLPTLWLYADRDPYYVTDHARANFQAYVGAGGEGDFRRYDLGAGSNGHALIDHPATWGEAVDAFLRDVAAARR